LTLEFDRRKIDDGKELRPTEASSRPSLVQWSSADEGKKYSLVMVDPDAPSREKPTQRNWLHWLLTNVAGRDLKGGLTGPEGDEVREYLTFPLFNKMGAAFRR